ncbi:MAG: heme-binding protein [Alphaproteobacteria bacterium]|nr:heme-binding protein [Alphaproteobacteria bacterium]
MSSLTLDQAETIIAAARRRRAALKEVPLAYAVVDSGGHLIAAAREDGAGFLRTEIALNKAWTCFALGMPLKTLRDRTRDYPLFFASIQGAAEGRIMHALGGVIIRDAKGVALGALGISGAAGEVDEAICVHAIEAAGLKAEVGGAEKA